MRRLRWPHRHGATQSVDFGAEFFVFGEELVEHRDDDPIAIDHLRPSKPGGFKKPAGGPRSVQRFAIVIATHHPEHGS